MGHSSCGRLVVPGGGAQLLAQGYTAGDWHSWDLNLVLRFLFEVPLALGLGFEVEVLVAARSWWGGDIRHLGGTRAEPALWGQEMPCFLHKQPGRLEQFYFYFLFLLPCWLFLVTVGQRGPRPPVSTRLPGLALGPWRRQVCV